MSVLRASGLSFAYGRREVLNGVDFTAKAGEVTVIVGPNGAGKTTLLRLLGRLLRPRSGRIEIDGRNIASLRRRALARLIASSPQVESAAWPLTVEQVVLLGRAAHRGWLAPMTTEDRKLVRQAMALAHLSELANRPLTELSGGEHRRVLFARILAQEPQVVLLDEPTAHLDLRHQEEVLLQVGKLARQRGLAVVATLHDLNQAAAHADSIALLTHGRLEAQGRPEDVLTAGRLREAYGLPVAVARHPVSGRLWLSPMGDADESAPER